MTVFKQELTFQRTSLIGWLVALVSTAVMFLALYPTFTEGMDTLREAVSAFPSDVLRSFGMEGDAFFSDAGLVAYTFSYIHLMLAIMGLLWGLTVVGRERIDHMSDFLLTRPLSRTSAICQKIAVGLVSIVVVNLILLLVSYASQLYFQMDDKTWHVLLATLFMGMLLHLLFFAIGSLMAVLMRTIDNPVGIASGVGLGFYVLLLMGRLVDNEAVMGLSPFRYADPLLLLEEGLEPMHVAGFLIVSVMALAVSILWFRRSDVEV